MIRPAYFRKASAGIMGGNTFQPEANQLPHDTKKVTQEGLLKNIQIFKKDKKNLPLDLQKVVSLAQGEAAASISHLVRAILGRK